MKDAPEGYTPFYIRLEKGGKEPPEVKPGIREKWSTHKRAFNEAVRLLSQGWNIGIAAIPSDPLSIVDVDDMNLVGDVKPTLVCQSRKRIGRHNFFFTNDESTYGKEDALFMDSAKDNIDTDTAGEVRSNNQYVVCAGSFVECSEEEALKIPEEDRINAGKYSVFSESAVSYITYEELPEIYRQKHESEKLAEIEARFEEDEYNERDENSKEDSKNKSKLWDLSIPGLTGRNNDSGKRFPMFSDFHNDDSKTGGNASISKNLLHCWRHNVSHNSFSYLAVKAGILTCNDAGRKFKGRRFGANRKDPETVYKVWLYAKNNKLIPENDPMPSRALQYAAISQFNLCSKSDLIDDWKLPAEIYNQTIEKLKASGINPGRTPLNKKSGLRGAAKKLVSGLSITDIVEGLQEEVPVYFDNGKNFWMWNNELCTYQRIDETEIMCQITEHLDLTIYSKDFKNLILEGIRQTGRLRRVKPTKKEWIQFENGVFDLETGGIFEATPDYFFVSQIPHKLGDSEQTPILDKLFTDWQSDKAKLLEEICAYSLLDDYPIQRIFAFIGPGGNGKGQFTTFVKRLLGIENCVGTDLDRLSDSRFEASKLFKKKAAFVGETNYTLSKTSLLKSLTGGDTISGEFKGRDSFDFVNTAKIFISTNGLPITTDRSEGFYRRWCLIEFKNRFSDGKDIINTVPEIEYQNFCRKAIRLLRDIINNGKLQHEPEQKDRKEQYEKLSNPIQAFLDNDCRTGDELFVPVWYLYEQYNIYREAKGHRHILQNEFAKIVEGMGYNRKQKWFNSKDISTFKNNSEVIEGKNWMAFEGIALNSRANEDDTEDSRGTSRILNSSPDTENTEETTNSSQSMSKSPSELYIEPESILPLEPLEIGVNSTHNKKQGTVFSGNLATSRNSRIHGLDNIQENISSVVSVEEAAKILEEEGI